MEVRLMALEAQEKPWYPLPEGEGRSLVDLL
jgi:hypothetical protein